MHIEPLGRRADRRPAKRGRVGRHGGREGLLCAATPDKPQRGKVWCFDCAHWAQATPCRASQAPNPSNQTTRLGKMVRSTCGGNCAEGAFSRVPGLDHPQSSQPGHKQACPEGAANV